MFTAVLKDLNRNEMFTAVRKEKLWRSKREGERREWQQQRR